MVGEARVLFYQCYGMDEVDVRGQSGRDTSDVGGLMDGRDVLGEVPETGGVQIEGVRDVPNLHAFIFSIAFKGHTFETSP